MISTHLEKKENMKKSKQRNRLNTKNIEFLNSKRLVTVDSGGNCFNFNVDNHMRRLLNKDIYDNDSDFESD